MLWLRLSTRAVSPCTSRAGETDDDEADASLEDGEGGAGGNQEVTEVDQETKENVPLKKKRGRKRIMPFWSGAPSAPVVLPDMFR